MKQLSQALEIGPKYSADFERAGIRTLSELARVQDLQELSQRTDIPIDLVRQWHEQAKQKIQASRYRRRVATGISAAGLVVLAWLSIPHLRSPASRIYAQADALYEKGNYQRAQELYDRVIKRDPKNQLAYANRGGALRRLGRTEEALAALDKALELNPKDVWALDERGRVYADRHEYARAIQDYDQAIQLDRKYKFAYADKGRALRRLGRTEEALAALDKLLELNPKDVWALDERGRAYADRHEYARAIQDYDQAIQLDRKYQVAYADKAVALRRLGRTEEALAALDTALELDPRDAWAYSERGAIYHDNLFQYEAAYRDSQRASDLEPSRGTYKANLAEAALTSGRFEEAFDLASKILADNENTNGNEFGVSTRVSMRIVAISALLLEGRAEQTRGKLEEFVRYYRSVAPNFESHWNYSGTRHFIEGRAMDGRSKNIMLNLIQLLDRPPKSTIEQIEKLVSTLR